MAGTQRYWDGSQWTDHRAPGAGGKPRSDSNPIVVAAILLVGAILALGLWAAASPTLNIPVISETVCSIKGKSWFGEPSALYGVDKPGCYETDSNARSSITPPPQGNAG